ncbi:MAG: MFS transporter [Chloroflexi bacterium]|nr:MFS transporter [Chloroflexota bacterium]
MSTTRPEFKAVHYVTISAYAFALSSLWNGLHAVLLPAILLGLVADTQKNTYLGLLTFTGLTVAAFAQPVFGAISDGSRLSWGRRRPFILLGALLALPFLGGLGFSSSFALLFVFYLLLQLASNFAQAPYQALIPDLVPERRRGLASGAKNLAEIVALISVVLVLGQLADRFLTTKSPLWLGAALGSQGFVLLLALLITQIGVPERPFLGSVATSAASRLVEGLKALRGQGAPLGWFLLSRFFFLMPITAVQTFAFYFMQDVIGVPDPASATATLVATIAIAILLFVFPAGFLSDRLGRKPMILSAGVIGALGSVLLIFAQSYEQTLLFGSLLGVSIGLFLSSNWALATDLAMGTEAAMYLGLTNLATAGGGAAARLNGPLIDMVNAQSFGAGYDILFIICASSFLFGSATILRVRGSR